MTDRSSNPPRDPRKVHIPAPGERLPATTVRPRPRAEADGPRPTGPAPRPRPSARRSPGPSALPPVAPGRRRRRLLPHRPKLRRVLLLTSLLVPLLLLATLVGGYLYGRNLFNKIDRVQVSQVLSPKGDGTNYLIVGSDSRDESAIKAAGLNPAAFQDGGGERSDTILVLRFYGGKAYMLSIPRDLYVPIAGTGRSHKINAAYGGGPTRLIQTVQQALGIPIQHYVEIDFVSFALLVDALHGVDIDFPHPAFDRNTGLDVTTAGTVHLNGPQALAFVRSRHYVEVIDGRNVPDATGDLGRVHRQQEFLSAVLSKLGHSKNPFTLARAATNASSGLRVDDSLGFLDAARLAMKLRGLHPLSVVLPTKLGANGDGSVLFLVHPDADPVLASFKDGTPGPVVTTTTTAPAAG